MRIPIFSGKGVFFALDSERYPLKARKKGGVFCYCQWYNLYPMGGGGGVQVMGNVHRYPTGSMGVCVWGGGSHVR